ncbi:MAG TPA: M23 family metallopeptidase, partial [Kineosporiaceae bacterium]
MTMPDGPAADAALDRIAGVASTYGTGLSQLKIATLLRGRKAAGGRPAFGQLPAAALGIGRQQVTGGGVLPDTALGPRRSQSEAQRPSGISSIQGTGTLGDSLADQFRHATDAHDWQSMTPPPVAFGGAAAPSGPVTPGGSGFSPMGALGAPPDAAGGGSPYRQFVTQGLGNPIPGRAPHPGVDLAFPPGTAVTCPADGVVEHISRNGTGIEVGAAVHIRAEDGTLWKLYHIDPATFPSGLRVGQRIARGTPLGRTYSISHWKGPNGQSIRTHLHVGHVGSGGALLDPLGPGGLDAGALTGGASPGGGFGGGGPITSPGQVAGGTAGSNITVDVRMHVTHDPAGKPVVRVRGAAPSVTSSPGQIVGGSR